MNFSSYNSILPSSSNPGLSGITNSATNPAMYSFMTRQLALAIQRANSDLRPRAIGWGQTSLLGITQNRSLGAHLANYGADQGANGGSVSQDPGGHSGTNDPTVNVLRVDQYRRFRKTVRTRRGRRHVKRTRTVTHAPHGQAPFRQGLSGQRRTVKRRVVARSGVPAANDLGMQILWSSAANGNYLARWEVPVSAPGGTYRFLISGKQYTLTSQPSEWPTARS